jgi:hypothetical protein
VSFGCLREIEAEVLMLENQDFDRYKKKGSGDADFGQEWKI